ncbi:MAG: hypothetical protein ACYSYV_11675 [Planctomycetota bacterium]
MRISRRRVAARVEGPLLAGVEQLSPFSAGSFRSCFRPDCRQGPDAATEITLDFANKIVDPRSLADGAAEASAYVVPRWYRS